MKNRKQMPSNVKFLILGLLLAPFVSLTGYNDEFLWNGFSAVYSFFVIEHYQESATDEASFTESYVLVHRDSEGRMLHYDEG